MALKNNTRTQEAKRQHKRLTKLKDTVWQEMNQFSGISGAYQVNSKVFRTLDQLCDDLESEFKTITT